MQQKTKWAAGEEKTKCLIIIMIIEATKWRYSFIFSTHSNGDRRRPAELTTRGRQTLSRLQTNQLQVWWRQDVGMSCSSLVRWCYCNVKPKLTGSNVYKKTPPTLVHTFRCEKTLRIDQVQTRSEPVSKLWAVLWRRHDSQISWNLWTTIKTNCWYKEKHNFGLKCGLKLILGLQLTNVFHLVNKLIKDTHWRSELFSSNCAFYSDQQLKTQRCSVHDDTKQTFGKQEPDQTKPACSVFLIDK